MRQTLFIMAAALLCAMAFMAGRSTRPAPTAAVIPPEPVVAAPAPSPEKPKAKVAWHPTPHPLGATDDVIDPVRLRPDPVQEDYRKRVETHMDVRSYLNSPASKTAQGKAILALLRANGYGIHEFQHVYAAALTANSLTHVEDKDKGLMGDQPFDPNNTNHVRAWAHGVEAIRETALIGLKNFLRTTNDDLVKAIVETDPTAMYQWDPQLVPGEKFLTETDLPAE